MNDVNDELDNAVYALLRAFTPADTTPIRAIHSYDFCEDGATLLITLTMGNGSDTFISLAPGRPISIHRTEPARHLFCVRNAAV